MSKQKQQRGGGVDLLEVAPPTASFDTATPEPFRGDPPPASACVGRPVQFCRQSGTKLELLAGILTRQSQADPARWDVTIVLPGGVAISRRSNVPYSVTPREGCWNLLPE